MNRYLLATLSVIIIAFAAWYFFSAPTPTPPIQEAINFIHDGVVLKDNPGFTPGVWYLSYEEPGSPGLS
ncbi:hypothetical protein, partial [Streptococcus pneumoniae]|uniref:hypothetical protein n=1 Tax=Streptococcus pneumoniae TaxID=1313 RepID=UPI000B1C965A